MNKVFWLMLISLLAATPAQATKVYKWHDQSGQIQYTQTPPPAGHEFEIVEPGMAVGATSRVERGSPASPGRNDDPEEASDDAPDNAQAETAEEEAIHVVSREDAAQACADARERLETLQGSDSMLMTRNEDGELEPMSEEAIEKRIEEEQARIRQFCEE